MEALDFEMERSRTLVHFAHEKPALAPVRLTEGWAHAGSHPSASLRIQHNPGDLKALPGQPESRPHLAVLFEMDGRAQLHSPILAPAERVNWLA